MNPLCRLLQHGQSYWLDNLTRPILQTGQLKRRVDEECLRGVTSNPAIFRKSIASGQAYDQQIREAIVEHRSTQEIYEDLATTDIRNACDVLRPVYDASEGQDGFVSLEVSPHLAHDPQASVESARHLFQLVNRPNVLIKIPGTPAGLSATEELLFEGIHVNITLLFSVSRYEEVSEAYIRALERRLDAGKALSNVSSVASFFLSRIDSLVDQLLRHRIGERSSGARRVAQQLLGRTAVANAKLAYQAFQAISTSERWRALLAKGAKPQRLLWASTSTKNPEYSDVAYVEPLIGPNTVNTMPDETARAFADHGRVRTTIEDGVEEARQVMQNLTAIGIDFNQVTQQLENEGIQKFIDPYDALLTTLAEMREAFLNRQNLQPLQDMARQLRRDVIEMTTAAGSGHPSSCLSSADIVTALFFHEMRWDPADPGARNVDRFILSKGHAAPLLWAALSRAGAIGEDPRRLRQIDSTLEGHPTPANPWVKVATGSLGQGLSAANGFALANRLDQIDAQVYCLLGDGECSEGSIWEAAQFASLQRLSKLTAIVDLNGLGQSGPAPYRHDASVLAQRFQAFGWYANVIDGHDMGAILNALASAKRSGPAAIIARTEKGKGVSFLEGLEGWHGKALGDPEATQALAELGEVHSAIRVTPRRVGNYAPRKSGPAPALKIVYEPGQQAATRDGFGEALAQLGAQIPELTVLDGDVQDSTRTKEFAQRYPDRFFQGYIAEQNMVGTALGLAVNGKTAVAATFACFLTRAADFIRMAGHSRPDGLVLCGSHAGVSVGEDGPSQMGLEDVALFRAVSGSTVLCPSDAVSAQRLTEAALQTPGFVYLRTTRPKSPVIYSSKDDFPVGGSKTLRTSSGDRLTIVAAGITVHEALSAHEELLTRGLAARVIDAYSIKPLDVATLNRAARETDAIIVVEDHWKEGGLGEAVAAVISGTVPVHHLAVTGEPRSGTPEELLDRHNISQRAIVETALALAF